MFGQLFKTRTSVVTSTGYVKRSSAELLARCAVRLLNVSNIIRTTVYVTMSAEVTDDFRTQLLLSVRNTCHCPVVLLNRFNVEFFNQNRYVRPDAYIVAARNASDLAGHLDTINVTDASWYPEAYFVVVLETLAETSERVLGPLFQRFWSNNLFQSVLLVPSSPPAVGNGGAAAVYALAWYPFQNRCGEYHAPKTMDTCIWLDDGNDNKNDDDDNNYGFWRNGMDLFDKRIPKVFRNCTVRIAGFHWPPMTLLSNGTPRAMSRGMDVEVVKLMSRIGNVNLEFKEIREDQRWGVMTANGTWTGGFGELSRHRADILIGGSIMTTERAETFDASPPRQVIRFAIYTPMPKRLPYWENMLNVFAVEFWLTLFLVFVLTSCLFWLSGRLLPVERHAFADGGHCFITSWAILCSVAGGRQPTSTSSKMVNLLPGYYKNNMYT